MARKKVIKSGKEYYHVKATIGADEFGKQIQKSFYGKTIKEAEQKKKDYLNDIEKGISIDFKNAKLSSLMKVWLFEIQKQKIAYISFEKYEAIYRNHILTSKLSNMIISEIKQIIIQREYNNFLVLGKSTSMIKEINKI